MEGETQSLGALIPLGDLAMLEILGALGATPTDNLQDMHLWFRLALGARLETRTIPFRYYASVRAAYLRDAPASAWGQQLGPTIIGDTSYGQGHLAAIGGAAGSRGSFPAPIASSSSARSSRSSASPMASRRAPSSGPISPCTPRGRSLIAASWW